MSSLHIAAPAALFLGLGYTGTQVWGDMWQPQEASALESPGSLVDSQRLVDDWQYNIYEKGPAPATYRLDVFSRDGGITTARCMFKTSDGSRPVRAYPADGTNIYVEIQDKTGMLKLYIVDSGKATPQLCASSLPGLR